MENMKAGEHEQRNQVMLRSHVERCLQDIWDTRELITDIDDDYPFRYGTAACWVSLLDGPNSGVRVFAHAAHGLKTSAKLLREVNELNVQSRWARLALHEGTVRVSVELHWSAVDRLALEHSLRAVGQVSDDVGALLATVYGGSTPFPPEIDEQCQNSDEDAA